MIGPRGRRRDEHGFATMVALGLVAVLVVVALVAAGAVAIVLAHRRAQVAADLASLAGASALQHGADPCVAAADIAGRQRARLAGCAIDGLDVVVSAAVDLPTALGGRPMAARARAGPASVP